MAELETIKQWVFRKEHILDYLKLKTNPRDKVYIIGSSNKTEEFFIMICDEDNRSKISILTKHRYKITRQEMIDYGNSLNEQIPDSVTMMLKPVANNENVVILFIQDDGGPV